jgi:hypothetical protein
MNMAIHTSSVVLQSQLVLFPSVIFNVAAFFVLLIDVLLSRCVHVLLILFASFVLICLKLVTFDCQWQSFFYHCYGWPRKVEQGCVSVCSCLLPHLPKLLSSCHFHCSWVRLLCLSILQHFVLFVFANFRFDLTEIYDRHRFLASRISNAIIFRREYVSIIVCLLHCRWDLLCFC